MKQAKMIGPTEDLSDRLQAVLVQRGWQQVDLAKELDVSDARISVWIARQGRPHPRQFKRLTQVLDVTPDELFLLIGRQEWRQESP